MVLSRTTDPSTSHEAARNVEASGTDANQRDTCLRCVMHNPGLTATQVAQRTKLGRHVPSRRLLAYFLVEPRL